MAAVSKLFQEFFRSERSGGLLLIACTIVSLVLSNLWSEYHDLWTINIGGSTLTHLINDGLMTIFFLLIGLELEREIYIGELSSIQKASFPVIAALGGMLVPAGIYILLNLQTDIRGFGIPMATDIAFAIGVLSLLGNKVPAGLKIFLTALAVIDDLGAIMVIAVFYSTSIHLAWLAATIIIFLVLFLLNRLKIQVLWIYLVVGAVAWWCMLHSGIHATLAGVILAFAIPFGDGGEDSISYRLQDRLHWPVAFIVLPIFALANTSIVLQSVSLESLTGMVTVGIVAGLVLGKPIGIFGFGYLATKLGLSVAPSDSTWRQVFGVSILGGIGFTMSIFIALLAFDEPHTIDAAKIAIMLASTLAGIVGFVVLRAALIEYAAGDRQG